MLRTHYSGTVLYVEGQTPDGLFILCNGRAKISMSSKRGSLIILKVAQAGEALGLEAVLTNRPHEETAQLLDSCQVKFIPRRDLHAFLEQHSGGALKAAYQLSANCSSARQQIRHIGFSVSGSERLARLLITWAGADKTDQRRSQVIEVPFTHQEIAQMIGSTRETVTRVLNHWKRRGVLEIRGKTVILKDLEQLEKFANE